MTEKLKNDIECLEGHISMEENNLSTYMGYCMNQIHISASNNLKLCLHMQDGILSKTVI